MTETSTPSDLSDARPEPASVATAGPDADGWVHLSYRKQPQPVRVPPGATRMNVKVIGAQGAHAYGGDSGATGKGAQVTATIPVTAGDTLVAYTGEHPGGSGGWGYTRGGGGGNGNRDGGAGGGSSALCRGERGAPDEVVLIVAGGGGGAGGQGTTADGGNGGSASEVAHPGTDGDSSGFDHGGKGGVGGGADTADGGHGGNRGGTSAGGGGGGGGGGYRRVSTPGEPVGIRGGGGGGHSGSGALAGGGGGGGGGAGESYVDEQIGASGITFSKHDAGGHGSLTYRWS